VKTVSDSGWLSFFFFFEILFICLTERDTARGEHKQGEWEREKQGG